MPRPLRIQYPGAVYHVMCRGRRKEDIFLDHKDRETFLDTFAETHERSGFILHSFCLMTNHYHFLLETPEANLSEGMRWFQGTYTQRFNVRHGFVGPLYQGRFKAIPVMAGSGSYFKVVSDYIHLNPARAGLLKGEKLANYPYSSFGPFCGAKALPGWLTRDRLFRTQEFPDQLAGSRRRYRDVLELKAKDPHAMDADSRYAEIIKQIRRGWYLGSTEFRDKLEDLAAKAVTGRTRKNVTSTALRRHDLKEARQLLRLAMAKIELNQRNLKELRKGCVEKQAVAWLLKTRTTATNQWISDQLHMGDESNITRAAREFRSPKGRKMQSLKSKMQEFRD